MNTDFRASALKRHLGMAKLLLGLALISCSLTLRATGLNTLVVDTFAGAANYGAANGLGTAARFLSPAGVAVDSFGNVYVADYGADTIRLITPSQVVTIFAGQTQVVGTNNGTGTNATLSTPSGVAVDSAGNVYVADSADYTIRKITPAGVVTTFAGVSGQRGYLDGSTNVALFTEPNGIAVDSSNNVYVTDSYINLIRKISNGTVTTLAGDTNLTDINNLQNSGTNDGVGAAARFFGPYGITADGAGNVYVSDVFNDVIRAITPAGKVTTIAGQDQIGSFADGAGGQAKFFHPFGVTVAQAGTLYVSDTGNQLIRKMVLNGTTWVVSTVAGDLNSPGTSGDADGFLPTNQLDGPYGLTVDGSGNIYVADLYNANVRKIAATNNYYMSTYAGPDESTGAGVGAVNGFGQQARFHQPHGVALDPATNLFVADSLDNCIRMVTPAGDVATIAGSSTGVSGSADGASATFYIPAGVCVDAAFNVYVADFGNSTIRKITPVVNSGVTNWITSTIAGAAGQTNFLNGQGTNARFYGPLGIAIDANSNLYVADNLNQAIRKIDTSGNVTTIAGDGPNSYGFVNALGTNAEFHEPSSLVVDNSTSNIYVADTVNQAIRYITPDGMVHTLSSAFNTPSGIAIDSSGNLYITDSQNETILGIPQGGSTPTDLAGEALDIGSSDGIGTNALFYEPTGIAVDGAGNVYIADTFNNTVRKGVPLTAGSSVLTLDSAPSGLPVMLNGVTYSNTPRFIVAPTGGNNTVLAGTPAGFIFTGWTAGQGGSVLTTSNSYSFTLSANENVTANYFVQYISVTGGGNLAFGGLKNGTTTTGTLNITNRSNVPINVSSILYPLGYSGAFSGTIAAETNQAVTVTFAPMELTNFDGGISLVTDQGTFSNIANVSGFGDTGTLVLTVDVSGKGKVSPDYNGKTLKSGNKYVFHAIPANGWVFSNWTGSYNTESNPLTIHMSVGTLLEANFIPDPFLPFKGTYNGLVIGDSGVTPPTSGVLKNLTVGTKGTYSGVLSLNGVNHGLSGSFNVAGYATNVIKLAASQGGPFTVEMNLATSITETTQVVGTVFGTNAGVPWSSTLLADLATNTFKSGDFTLLIPPDSANSPPTSSPGGYGYAAITVHAPTSAKSPLPTTAALVGKLADGTPFSESVPVSEDGFIPVYANLYAPQKGMLLGWLNLEITNNSTTGLTWIHPTRKTGLYERGFTNELAGAQLELSPWTGPANLNLLTNLVILGAVGETNITEQVPIAISSKGKVTGNEVAGTLNIHTGLINLTVGKKTKLTLDGALVPNATNGGGFYLTKTNAQAFIIQ